MAFSEGNRDRLPQKLPSQRRRTQKERESVSRFPLKRFWFLRNLLVEVTLQHALQSLAVAGLVAGHLISHFASLVTASPVIPTV